MSQPQIINGQLCFNCTEVDRARRDLDPARTQEAKALGVDPSRILPDGQIKPKPSADGVSSSSQTSGVSTSAVSAAAALGVNQPLASGDKGRSFNLLT